MSVQIHRQVTIKNGNKVLTLTLIPAKPTKIRGRNPRRIMGNVLVEIHEGKKVSSITVPQSAIELY